MDVAHRAGVSQSLVSRSFSGHPSVADSTRARVLNAASELGYRPNRLARSLITQRSRLIAIVVGDISTPFYAALLKAITLALADAGYRAILSGHSGDDLNETIIDCLDYRPDGILLLAGQPSDETVQTCESYRVPILLFARSAVDSAAGSICCDNHSAGRDVAKMLLARGHRKFAYIGTTRRPACDVEREIGFIEGLELAGHRCEVWRKNDNSYPSGYAAALTLFSEHRDIDAVFCVSDLTAIGVSDALRTELGLRVPEDVSIVGFDDVPMASWATYDLTTIRQNTERMAQLALAMIQSEETDPFGARQNHRISGQLIRRGSTR